MATHPVSARESITRWWQLRSRGERRMLAAFALLAALALVWLAVWQPIARDTVRLEQRAVTDRNALAEARRASDEIAAVARAAPVAPVADPRAALEAILAARNLKGTATQFERLDNDRLRVTFDSIAFDALAEVLDALQREAHLRVTDLVATARVESGQVRADLTLTRG